MKIMVKNDYATIGKQKLTKIKHWCEIVKATRKNQNNHVLKTHVLKT